MYIDHIEANNCSFILHIGGGYMMVFGRQSLQVSNDTYINAYRVTLKCVGVCREA